MEDISKDNQSIAKSFAILSIAGIVVKVLSLFNTPLLNKILGEEGMGVYKSAYDIYLLLYVIANSGLPIAISKNISELIALGRYKDVIKNFKISRMVLFVIGFVLSMLMFVFAGPLSIFIGEPDTKMALRILAPTVLTTCVLSSYRGYFQGRANMKPTAISQVFEQIFNIVFSLGFGYLWLKKYGLEAGVAGATTGTLIGALVATLILILFYESNKKLRVVKEDRFNIKPYSSRKHLQKIILYAIPITLCVVIQNIGGVVDNKISSMFLPRLGMNSNVMVGWIFKYNSLIGVPIVIVTSLSAAVLPAISAFAALNDRRNLAKKTSYAYRLCLLVAVPSAVGLFSLSTPICKLLGYGPNVASLLKYGCLNIVVMAMVQIQMSIMQGIGRINLVTVHCFIGLMGKIIADFVFISISSINIYGIIISNFIYYIIPLILNSIAIRNTLRIRIKIGKRAFRIFISSVFMGVVAFLTNYCIYSLLSIVVHRNYLNNIISTIVSVIVAVYVYIYFLILTRAVKQSDFDVFPKKLLKLIPRFMLDGLQS